ncbi:MAG: elongation factor P [Candidatus Yanofskybacteria bacterium]|nr:elongation factor P [Candidatus Yanofskybacteria bacterium]
MALGVNELKPKTFFIYEGQPYAVLETHHLKMQQRRPTVQVKMRNMINGKVLERNFAQSDVFEEADIERRKVKFLYNHREQYWFVYENEPTKRFLLTEELIGEATKFLKANTVLDAIEYNGEIINIELPVKMEFKVLEAPPAIRGDTAQGGVKQVKIETGAYLNVPLFINQDDIVRINTETGEYVERVEKGK